LGEVDAVLALEADDDDALEAKSEGLDVPRARLAACCDLIVRMSPTSEA